MKILIYFFVLFAFLLFNPEVCLGEAQKIGFANQPKNTEAATEAILCLEEARILLTEVQKEGSISIQMHAYPSGFRAYWNAGRRAIVLNSKKQKSFGGIIRSILFEMHNAHATPKMRRLLQLARTGRISKEVYVEEMERLEHQNALKTKSLLRKGIQQGVFPKTAAWTYMPEDFLVYFDTQKSYGHSAFHEKYYDSLVRDRI